MTALNVLVSVQAPYDTRKMTCHADQHLGLAHDGCAVSSLIVWQRLSEARKNFIIAVNFLKCCGRDDMRLLSASYYISEELVWCACCSTNCSTVCILHNHSHVKHLNSALGEAYLM